MLLVHVVVPGDTLFKIAGQYGTTVEALIEVNQPPDPNNLVVGQALIIPTTGLVYTVRPGDTLYGISQVFGVGVDDLAAANDITNPDLIYPGQTLQIPTWDQLEYKVRPGDTLFRIAQSFDVPLDLLLRVNEIPNPDAIVPGQTVIIPIKGVAKRPLTTNGFIFPMSLTGARNTLTPIAPLLTYISIFDFPVDGKGGITPPNYEPLVQAAKELDIAPLAVLTNFKDGNFDPDLARAVMSDPTVRDATFDSLVELIQQAGMAGVMVDFENMYPEDRPLYTQFISELSKRMRELGLTMAIAMAPKWADYPTAPWVGAFDYAALGKLVDFMYIMTYEWGWVGGPPQPVAPVNLIRLVMDYATSLIPPDVLMQGIPLYGYDWPLPDTPENLASTVDPQQAIALAAKYGATIDYDTVAQSPTFDYTDSTGQAHEVWFEDARSARAKYQVTRDYNLMGAGFWQLSNKFPQNWDILGELFTIIKKGG